MKKALSLVLTMCIVLSLFATFVISASAEEAVNLAAGKTYTYTPTDSHYYHSNEDWACSKTATTALTDGVVGGEYYGAASMVGWTNCDPTVTIDLGKVSTVSELKYNVFAGMDGIAEPTSVKVEVSVDGNTWNEVTCTSAAGTHVSSSLSWVTGYAVDITLTPEAAVDAQYVRFTYTRTGSFVFLSEIEVWGVEKKAEVALEWKPFFLSHFDNVTVEGAGVVFTDDATNTNHAWRIHVVFAPIAGEENAYEIVDIIDYLQSEASKVTKTPVIPEGGFAYNLNYGNNYPSLNMDGPDYTSPNCNNMIADVLTWKIGDKLMFKNVDLEGKTVPTSTEGTNWYDDAYVCTAQYAAYVPGANQGTVVITKGDNIALNKTYTISGCGERGSYYAKLTDGVAKTEVSYNNDEWFGFYCNGEDQSVINAPDKLGYVVIDLGASYDIHSVSVNFVDLAGGSGIFAPTAVNAYLSADGETWSDAVALTIPAETTNGVSYAVEGEVSGNARYVKVDVGLGGTFAFLNEIEVYEAKKTVTGGSTPEVIVETITVDGDLTDTGWAKDSWVTVTPDNGYWQSVPESETISYKYQLRADETKLYAAFVVDCAAVEGGNGVGTNVRFWINTDSEATVYTHFYDVYLKDGAVAVNAKYNKAKDANDGGNIENSTIDAVMTTKDGKTYVEFSVDLAEFNGAEGFNYFVCVSNKVNENVCLYYPVVAEGETRTSNLPYAKWYAEGQATVDVEAIQLGEVVVNGGTNDNLGDAGIYAIAALAVVALIGTAVVIKRRA